MLNNTCLIIVAVLLFFMLAFLFVAALHRLFPKKAQRWLCVHLGWHDGEGHITEFDGCSVHAICSICGKPVMMDSQGNWFE